MKSPDPAEEARKHVMLVPVNADEFDVVVTHREAVFAQALNRGVVTAMMEEAVMEQRAAPVESKEHSPESVPDSRPVRHAAQGLLRRAVPGLDTAALPPAVDPTVRYVEPLEYRAPQPPEVPGPQTVSGPQMPVRRATRLEVIDPPTLPDKPATKVRYFVTLGGVFTGLLAGAAMVFRTRLHAT